MGAYVDVGVDVDARTHACTHELGNDWTYCQSKHITVLFGYISGFKYVYISISVKVYL